MHILLNGRLGLLQRQIPLLVVVIIVKGTIISPTNVPTINTLHRLRSPRLFFKLMPSIILRLKLLILDFRISVCVIHLHYQLMYP